MVDNEPDLTNWHFDPKEVTVTAGSTVLWHNMGKEEHSVTADNKSFDSGYRRRGADYQRTFSRPGNYSYYCAPHPWMTGVVRVTAAPTTTTVETTPTTVAPGPATATTFPPSLATQAPGQPAAAGPGGPAASPDVTTTTAAPATTTTAGSGDSEASSAAPAGSRGRSGRGLAGTLALVLIPTLAGLVLGAKLRRRS
jgi:hypothetical protein